MRASTGALDAGLGGLGGVRFHRRRDHSFHGRRYSLLGSRPTLVGNDVEIGAEAECEAERRAGGSADIEERARDCGVVTSMDMVDLVQRIDSLDRKVQALLDREATKDAYSTEEFGAKVGRSEFTVREWARHGRIQASKKRSGRGMHFEWVISHDELLRYEREGLLPLTRVA